VKGVVCRSGCSVAEEGNFIIVRVSRICCPGNEDFNRRNLVRVEFVWVERIVSEREDRPCL
jgi:hypothetical protein